MRVVPSSPSRTRRGTGIINTTRFQVKAQLAEQRKTAKKKASKTRPLELYEASSQGTIPSPDVRRCRQRDWGGSHRDPRPTNRGRVSEENENAESEESNEC